MPMLLFQFFILYKCACLCLSVIKLSSITNSTNSIMQDNIYVFTMKLTQIRAAAMKHTNSSPPTLLTMLRVTIQHVFFPFISPLVSYCLHSTGQQEALSQSQIHHSGLDIAWLMNRARHWARVSTNVLSCPRKTTKKTEPVRGPQVLWRCKAVD